MLTTRSARLTAALGLTLLSAPALHAQVAPATLTLEDAISLARQHNPGYRSQANDNAVADWSLRSAYGSLLPSVTGALSGGWQAGSVQRLGDVELARTPDRVRSFYSLDVNWGVDGSTFFNVKSARASHAATEAGIVSAGFGLEQQVTRQYLSALRARDAVTLAERQLTTAEEALRAAQSRVETGAAMRLDAAQAEVTKGQAEVALLQAQANEETERLRLLQVMGLDLDRSISLTTRPEVFEPKWTLPELTEFALARHPQLVAARAVETASKASSRSLRMSYIMPRVGISAGWSGLTNAATNTDLLIAQAEQRSISQMQACEENNDFNSRLARPYPAQNCAALAFTPADREAVIDANRLRPFDFQKDPATLNMYVSLPVTLFDGFTRETRIQQANAAIEDAKYRRRELELEQRAAVATSYLALQTAYRAVGIQERNAATAAEQLMLASERYRLGAGSIVELSQAQATRAQADQAHLGAVYAFHENLAALEAAVGRTLR